MKGHNLLLLVGAIVLLLVSVVVYDFNQIMNIDIPNIEESETRVFESEYGPIQYHVLNGHLLKESSERRKVFLYLHGTPSGYEEGKFFEGTMPSNWVIVSPLRIGYCKTMFEKFSESERKIINFYLGRENQTTFDFGLISNLKQLLNLEGQKKQGKIPSLDFILNANNLLMSSLMNHLVGENSKFSVIGVSGGGPYALSMAKAYPNRINALHLMVGVTRTMVVLSGETPKSLGILKEKLESDTYLVFDKRNSTLLPSVLSNYSNEYRKHLDEQFEMFSMQPFVAFQNYPKLLKWVSYTMYKVLSLAPSLAKFVLGMNTEMEKLQPVCTPKIERFTTLEHYRSFLTSLTTTYRKVSGYMFDFYLFMNLATDRTEYLNSIQVPTQIIASIHDKNVDFEENAMYAFKNIPNSQLIAYGDCGHFFMFNHMESITAQINTFA